MYLALLVIVILLITGCLSQEESAKARKYGLEYVYIEKPLELKEAPYVKKLNFKTRSTIEKTRFVIKLYYFNFTDLSRNVEPDKENLRNICNSLLGSSYEIYDKKNNKLIFSYKVTNINDIGVSTTSPSIFLGSDMQKEKNVNYEVVVNIPSKKDTKEQYLKPVFVVGVLKKPWL